MAIRVALHHKTLYEYDRPVRLSPQIIRLRPAPHCRTPVTAYTLKVEPAPHFLNWQQDPQSNFLARVVFPNEVRHFSVDVDLVAEMRVINPFDFFLDAHAEHFPFAYEEWQRHELAPFLEREPAGPRLRALLDTIDRGRKHCITFLVDLNRELQQKIAYVIRLEPGVQSCEETLERASGSCRDSAWLLVQILRHLGLAARFVSGYLIQLRADVKPLDGPAGPEQDFTDLHAWAEVYLPGAGWVGFDPTSGLLAAEGHLPVAATPEPSSAAPITGTVEACQVQFRHEMRIRRIQEEPRVTKPYSDEQWDRIMALGNRIDQELAAGDVRLTMGGEPTFVSIDDMDGAEWNTLALGPGKLRLAGELIRRLRQRFAPGGLLHHGQGKWYPGESLPRWALTCYWRRDGVPLWQQEHLLAAPGTDLGHSTADARRFLEALADRLGLDRGYVAAAYEDPVYYLRREGQLPVNVDPRDSKLEDAEERERLRQVFERGLSTPTGFVLPLERAWGQDGPTWQTGLWMLRGRHLVLTPGDSPIGLRLPLASLPWVEPTAAPVIHHPDPMVVPGPLPDRERLSLRGVTGEPLRQQRGVGEQPGPRDRMPARNQSADWVVRTALCVEVRGGSLRVFFPPLRTADDYVDLLAAVEDTAQALNLPVQIEGYTPPSDVRLNSIRVTPDPGVIEVNVHPAHSWDELVSTVSGLYEDARASRLGTEKFMLDGRHSGTGGGNHVVIGGPTPADSPLLRRPDLLRSLIGFWLNHPSLSYLFSTLFVGPTSQSPRVDETRADAVYELEIAFGMVPENGEPCPPWLVDRIFRHLLVDVTGNTHRAEFCIDKLYSPDGPAGRLGLLELRAFEMPPHARMSLTQQLLLRALVAWFWKEPYRERPIHWGTRLHDEFLLPFFIDRDFRDVLAVLNRAGYPFDAVWFAPHFEFRYPLFGTAVHHGVRLELRQAGEPWYVLGEEPGQGGTVRYVDSSVERIQVRVNGLVPDRHVVACNGRRIPLHPTGVQGEFVAGVRYRAWQPYSCLHPTIGVHTPLVFDILDVWSGRSVGGCTYHVAHPGGRNYSTFPVNANEAEARRGARFFPFGHTPGDMRVPPPEQNPEFPLTLDLRRPRQ